METKYKTIPFDVNRINEEGVQVTTRDGRNVRILCTDLKNIKPIVAAVFDSLFEDEVCEDALLYNADGSMCAGIESEVDLFLKIKVKSRRMTKQELSYWLKDCPKEHREYRYFNENDKAPQNGRVYQVYEYVESLANEPVGNILIRSNGGEWKEPLIED